MKVLFLVHTEEIFRKLMGEEYDVFLQEHIDEANYDRIIVLDSEVQNDVISVARYNADEIWAWGWGYEANEIYSDEEMTSLAPEGKYEFPDPWVISSCGHECTWVPYELVKRADEFRRAEIWIAGGADSECLEDWRAVLRHMDIPFNEVRELIYG